jgi:DNA-directed RNA polymerase omega subunit
MHTSTNHISMSIQRSADAPIHFAGPGDISRFRAVVVAALRAKQLRRGSKPRIEVDDKKHKDTSIAMEEVRRGLVTFTQIAVPQGEGPSVMRDLKAGVEQSLPVVG